MTKESYKYFPQTKDELRSLIKQRIEDEGNEVDLNDIDVSAITDMSELFTYNSDFNGDISSWDVSKVTNMAFMFDGCKFFNCNLSRWKVSKVTNMCGMFESCESFNQDLSNWDVSNVEFRWNAFRYCPIKDEYKPKFKQKEIMTREQAKQMAEVLDAYAEGKPIEVLLDGEWGEVDLNEYSFDESESYRIKKTQKYRPFRNAKECFEEMKKHQPFGWLKAKNIEQYYSITTVYNVENYNRYYNLFSNCTFVDGQPFGIKE